MFAYELEGLKRLNLDAVRWGSSCRVKVRGRTGKMAYVGNVSRPTNLKLVAKQYKISVETLEKHMSPDYKSDPKYRFYNGKHMESHLYDGIQPAELYDKLENVLACQTNAFEVNTALGYDLVSLTDGDFTQHWHPNLANTCVFNTPVAINSRSDIRNKIISEIRSMELSNTLNYPIREPTRRAKSPTKITDNNRVEFSGSNTSSTRRVSFAYAASKREIAVVHPLVEGTGSREEKRKEREVSDQGERAVCSWDGSWYKNLAGVWGSHYTAVNGLGDLRIRPQACFAEAGVVGVLWEG
ncbi:unnamed protein product [Phytophthora lilii]|uniref:Unnamed protein product n=1 Tax=Phytophthora lilii TaxID=2077276 RepID=A0A9W6UC01_9STRA|nr:unnamed protein product [Phytophthora lilii]